MTEPLDPRDDLASAYLDDEVDETERARVEADPDLLARVTALRAAAEAVAAPVEPPPGGARERALAAALRAAADVELEDPAAAAGPDQLPPAVPLAPPRPTPRRERPRWGRHALVAAVLLVVAAVGAVLVASDPVDDVASGGGEGRQRSSLEQREETSGGADERGSADAEGGGGGDAPAATVASAPPLGTHPDQAALTAALGAVDPTTLRPGPAGEDDEAPAESGMELDPVQVARCDEALRAIPGRPLGELLAWSTAVLGGDEVLVLSNPVQESDPPRTQLSVLDPTSCQVRFAVER